MRQLRGLSLDSKIFPSTRLGPHPFKSARNVHTLDSITDHGEPWYHFGMRKDNFFGPVESDGMTNDDHPCVHPCPQGLYDTEVIGSKPWYSRSRCRGFCQLKRTFVYLTRSYQKLPPLDQATIGIHPEQTKLG